MKTYPRFYASRQQIPAALPSLQLFVARCLFGYGLEITGLVRERGQAVDTTAGRTVFWHGFLFPRHSGLIRWHLTVFCLVLILHHLVGHLIHS